MNSNVLGGGGDAVPRIRALVVGINTFPNLAAEYQLHGCVRDAENISSLLINTYGVLASDIRQLHDERATRKAILDRLADLISQTRKDEVAVFHISTHGALITRRDPSGALKDHASEILCLADISPNLDDPDAFISDSDLTTLLAKLNLGAQFIVIMDACHAGASQIARDLSPNASSAKRGRFLPAPADIKHRDEARKAQYGIDQRHRLFERASQNAQGHVLVLTACGPNETASDTTFGAPPQAEGAFTNFLCDTLRQDRSVTYDALINGVQKWLISDGDRQSPEFMPAEFSDLQAFRPLPVKTRSLSRNAIKEPRFVIRSVGQHDPLPRSVTDDAPDDERYRKLISQLEGNGFEVHLATPEDVQENLVVDVQSSHTALLLEYRNGLAIWSKPVGKESVRTRGDLSPEGAQNAANVSDSPLSTGSVRHYFKIRPLQPSKTARGFDDVGENISRIFHIVVHPVEIITHAVIYAAEKSVFDEGLYQLLGNSFDANRTENPTSQIVPPVPQTPRAVLFIHGVLSSIQNCFGKPKMTELLGELRSQYIVLGYDHLSASVSVRDIAQQLDSRLRQCLPDNVQLDIVAHSQGGVIARQLGQLRKVNRIITFGSPHQGTNLANSLDELVTVLGALPLPMQAITVLFKILKCIDNPSVIPGFLDMKVGSDCISALNAAQDVRTSFYCGTSDFKPDPNDGVLARLADELDSSLVFRGDENDLVIDTNYMVPPSGFHVSDTLSYGVADHVIHTNYFDQDRSAQFVGKVLMS